MDIIGEQKLWSFADRGKKAATASCAEVRKRAACRVRSYMDLATKVAELQFMNRDFVLLFRGQSGDYKNDKGNTSLKPGLFRSVAGLNPDYATLLDRFGRLQRAEGLLQNFYMRPEMLGRGRLRRERIVRWSILQHYEVCPTPLLDVTHSLRIAASFASAGDPPEAYIFVIGVPNLSGAITASAEAGLQIVRLSSVCPPMAVRPHIQEGYLLGEYPEIADYDQKQHYPHFEIDFGRRLVAKFRLDPREFWRPGAFERVPEAALYPNASDPVFQLTQNIKQMLN